jgi:catechol 2,3-dioxygenase-like lactoylglutathione lyase family enzyme
MAQMSTARMGPPPGALPFARIRAQGVQYYADPRRAKPGEINHLHGGRGVYFDDPNGHVMEIITHPYGDRPEQI